MTEPLSLTATFEVFTNTLEFVWGVIASPKEVGVGFPVTITVKDGSGADKDANFLNFRDGQAGYMYVRSAPGKWASARQVYSQLSRDASTGRFEIRDPDGAVRTF